MTLTWHVDPGVARRYATGAVSPAVAASLEAHVVRCADCRALLAHDVDPLRLDAVWAEVVEQVDAPRAGALERLLHALGVRSTTARLLAATPSLSASWLTGVGLALTFALVASRLTEHGVAVFLALAPVLPVLGVAVAFGPATDPVHEIAAASPYSSFRLLVLRSTAVVTVTLALALVAAALVPGPGWLPAAWLLPALALTSLTLALAERVDPTRAGGALAILWVLGTLPGVLPHADPLLATHAGVQLGALAVALGACSTLARRAVVPYGRAA